VFVPYTLPGEAVDVEPVAGHPDRRHLLHVETASAERIEPICPHFGVCGGCAMQHWNFARYQDWKRGLLVTALEQAGIDALVDALIDAHGEGRRRITLHAWSSQRGVIEVGFSALRTHQIVAIDRCPVLAPALDRAIPGLGKVVKQNANVGVAAGINALGKEAVLEGRKARTFPLRFSDGAVFFGPLKVAQIPPLF
jgi:23S rRNA (uracil1939-C5)-methyltransferase